MSYNPNFVGAGSVKSASAIIEQYLNTTGSTIVKATPVKAGTNGNIEQIDLSVELDALSILGLAVDDVNNGQEAQVIKSGRLENISGFNVQDILYVAKNGSLTSEKPSAGVGGFEDNDFVVMIGVVVKNTNNPVLQDLIININIIGQI